VPEVLSNSWRKIMVPPDAQLSKLLGFYGSGFPDFCAILRPGIYLPDVRNTPLEDCYYGVMGAVFGQIVKPDSQGAV